MSNQLDRNQEIWDTLAYLQRKIENLEAYLNDDYESEGVE